mmetsp:Transcript_7468/g.20383  ORF Transcript_7468/g.20383 Transcript_7468/m.20383 type:complete len:263 (-) Transcript_7468:1960-2748(-)
MYSNKKLVALSTPFCTFISGVRYSFISAGMTVKGAQLSATMAMATVVQTLFSRFWTLRLLRRVTSTSCGPIAFAMYPNVATDARRIDLRGERSISRSSKQMRIHSLAWTWSAARSATEPTSLMASSCTLSCLFLRIGAIRGTRSLTGGVMFSSEPTASTMALSAPRMDPRTSGYSSPRFSNRTIPKCPSSFSSSHRRRVPATFVTRSAAPCLIFADLLFSLHLIVPTICPRYGPARSPRALITVPNPFNTTGVSSVSCSWYA